MESNSENNTVFPTQGRGRGRGGGVPVLPAGMWESMTQDVKNSAVREEYSDTIANARFGNRTEDPHPSTSVADINRRRDRNQEPQRSGIVKDLKGADWNCPSCDNLNWSWRSTCNKCNTAKPSLTSDTEVRDGVGGGFMERQERASKASVEVDEDGFDDFGRRKKKSAADRRAKEEAALKRLQQNYGFLLPTEKIDDEPTSSAVVSKLQDGVKKSESITVNDEHTDKRNNNNRPTDQDRDRENRRRDSRDRNRESDYRNRRDERRDRSRSRDRGRDQRRRSRSRSGDRLGRRESNRR